MGAFELKEKPNKILFIPAFILIIVGIIGLFFSINMFNVLVSVICSIIGLFFFSLLRPSSEWKEQT